MTRISMKFARTAALGIWSIASMALAEGKTTQACFEGGPQGKPVATAKTHEECQKLGEKFVWADAPVAHDHKAHVGKGKSKVKQQAKTEAKPAEVTSEAAPVAQPAAQPVPATEAPKK